MSSLSHLWSLSAVYIEIRKLEKEVRVAGCLELACLTLSCLRNTYSTAGGRAAMQRETSTTDGYFESEKHVSSVDFKQRRIFLARVIGIVRSGCWTSKEKRYLSAVVYNCEYRHGIR